MSRIIKLTKENIEEITKDFQKALLVSKLSDGKINFSKTISGVSRKAILYFTDMAWQKMQALIREFDNEVAWHGVASRCTNSDKDEYLINDILVYPQEVGAATVEMDTTEYAKWICDNAEDERFFNIRLQGHSHVEMTTSPSSVDLAHQEEILKQLTDDMFYIFVIWNKKGDKNIKIYDLEKNILFENSDIEVSVIDDGYELTKFVSDAKKIVKERKYSKSYYAPGYGVNYNIFKNEENSKKNNSSTIVKTEKNESKKRKGKKKKNDGVNNSHKGYSWYDYSDSYYEYY